MGRRCASTRPPWHPVGRGRDCLRLGPRDRPARLGRQRARDPGLREHRRDRDRRGVRAPHCAGARPAPSRRAGRGGAIRRRRRRTLSPALSIPIRQRALLRRDLGRGARPPVARCERPAGACARRPARARGRLRRGAARALPKRPRRADGSAQPHVPHQRAAGHAVAPPTRRAAGGLDQQPGRRQRDVRLRYRRRGGRGDGAPAAGAAAQRRHDGPLLGQQVRDPSGRLQRRGRDAGGGGALRRGGARKDSRDTRLPGRGDRLDRRRPAPRAGHGRRGGAEPRPAGPRARAAEAVRLLHGL